MNTSPQRAFNPQQSPGAASGPQPRLAGPGGRPMLGRYALVREIARSNDIVYEGLDTTMNRRVAVKELALDPTLNGQARRERIERFFREARAAGAMNHPNIVTIHEVGEDHGRFFIAMEYLEGQTLRDRLSIGGALPLAEAVGITSALCDALSYAHSRGVVHRDIKPDNVHVLPGGIAKLTDFGIARILTEQQLTVAGQIFGTPSYMSPEQVLGSPVDSRSDIFSLGVMLYEMVTGRKPFTGDTVVTITYKIMHEPTPPATGVPFEVDAALRRAMAKSPGERFASAAEFKAALQAAVSGQMSAPISAAHYPQSPAPLPGGHMPTGGPMPATVAYGPQTQQHLMGAAMAPSGPSLMPAPPAAVPSSGLPAAPTPSFYPSTYPVTPVQQPTQRNGAVVTGVIVLLLLIVGGTGWGISLALKNAQRQTVWAQGEQQYGKGAGLYKQAQYEQAAAIFKRIREAGTARADTLRRAAAGEVYCYRMLGQAAQGRNDNARAEEWYQAALNVDPQDAAAKQELEAIRKLRGGSSSSSSTTASTSGTKPASNPAADPNNPLAGVLSRPSPGDSTSASPPPSSLPATAPIPPALPAQTAQDFTSANNQANSNAAMYLSQGNQAWRAGDRAAAFRYWRQAVTVGPGSAAALEAQEYISRYADSEP